MASRLHSFGGSALDRHIFDFEDGLDGGDGGGVAVAEAPAEASAADAAVETPTWTPEQLSSLRDAPELREFVAAEAAQIAAAQIAAAQAQQSASGVGFEAQQAPGVPSIDPFADDFGQQLQQLLAAERQATVDAMREMFAPMQQQQQAQQQAEGDEMIRTAITETATRLGGIRGGDAAINRVLAAVRTDFFPEAARVYGQTDRAAEVAIERALTAEREYQAAIVAAGVGQHVEHINTLAGARPEIGVGSGSGVVTMADKPLNARELSLKYGGKAAALRGH